MMGQIKQECAVNKKSKEPCCDKPDERGCDELSDRRNELQARATSLPPGALQAAALRHVRRSWIGVTKRRSLTNMSYVAKITVRGKKYCLGTFRTAEEAAAVYDAEARKERGDGTSCNFASAEKGAAAAASAIDRWDRAHNGDQNLTWRSGPYAASTGKSKCKKKWSPYRRKVKEQKNLHDIAVGPMSSDGEGGSFELSFPLADGTPYTLVVKQGKNTMGGTSCEVAKSSLNTGTRVYLVKSRVYVQPGKTFTATLTVDDKIDAYRFALPTIADE
jgi:hypothetical protein